MRWQCVCEREREEEEQWPTMGVIRQTSRGRRATGTAGKGEGLTGKLREAHSFFASSPLQNSSWDRCAFTDGRECTSCWLPPPQCVCVFICWVCTADCMLAETLLCVITGETKPIDQDSQHYDKNRHLNTHMVFWGRKRRWECLCTGQRTVHITCMCLKGCVQKNQSQLVCMLFKETVSTTGNRGILFASCTHCSADYAPSTIPLLHTFIYKT